MPLQTTARPRDRAIGSIWRVLFGAFVLIGGFLLFTEHRAHVLGALPYVLALLVLFFCMFGMRHVRGGGQR